jgi:type VI secretion system protein VasI
VSQRFGGEQKADLWITCREEQTSIFLTFGNLFLADNGSYGDVTLRIDKQKARVISMNESTNNQALGLWRGTGGKLIKSMFGATSLFVQVTPFNESAVTAEFNIAELEQAIAPLRKACKW